MNKKILSCLLISCFSLGKTLFAAWVVTYSMTPSVPGFTQIFGTAGNNVLSEPISCSDQILTTSHPIGFTFQFDGTNYTNWQLTDNGCLIFGGAATTTCGNPEFNSQIPNDLSDASTMYRPFLAPLWDELWFKPTSAFGQGSYKLQGSAPNRTLTVEWLFMSWRGAGAHTTDDISFQVVLHETTMVIDFIYNNGAGTLNIPTASCGLGAIAGSTYYSLNNLTGAPGVSSTVATNSLAAKPTNIGQMYRWTPSAVLPIDLISFSGINFGKENQLEWTAGSQTNNHYFTLLRSGEATGFSEVARVDGAGTCSMPISYAVTDHEPYAGTTYYQLKWTDYNGGFGTSSIIALTGSDTSLPAAVFPNPANTILNISYLKNDAHYSIIDLSGRLIREGDITTSNPWLDVMQITDGIYFLVLNEKTYYRICIHHG